MWTGNGTPETSQSSSSADTLLPWLREADSPESRRALRACFPGYLQHRRIVPRDARDNSPMGLSAALALRRPVRAAVAPAQQRVRRPGGGGKRDRDCEIGLAVAIGDGKAEGRKPGYYRSGRRRDKRRAAAADHEEPVATRIIAP